MKNSNRVWNIISWVIFALLIAVEGMAVFQIWKLNMLPGKYFAVLLAVIAVVTLLMVCLLFQKRGKYQKVHHGKQIVGWLLSLVIICGCLFGGGAVARLNETMKAITSVSTVNVLLDVYVRSDDAAQYINDCAGYVFGVVGSEDPEQLRSAVEDIGSVLETSIETKNYDNAFAMVDALFNGEVDAMILNASYVDILGELEEYSDFSEKVRLIHEHVAQKVVIQLPAQEQKEEKKGDITKEPFLLYISGNDARKALLADGGSDVNILLAVNPVDKQILMVSTPRDYFVENPAGDNARDKLSHCGLAGIDNSVQAINQLYGQSIDYYAKINFSGFKTLVDAVGGVTIYSDVAFTTSGGVTIQKGENHLNGTQALAFVRERKALAGGDNDRGKNQMKVISAMINQLSAGTLIANYTDILDSLDGMFATSIPAEDIAKLVSMQLTDMASWDVLSFAVTGDNGHDQPWALNGLYAYVMYPHEEEVAFASGLIDRVLAGEVLTEADLSAE